jgi:hypothetical protein
MRTLRNRPSLYALRNARNERAIWAGALCIDPLWCGINISRREKTVVKAA